MKQAIATDKAPAAIGPYSQAIEAGNMIFVSGQLPVNPSDGLMADNVTAQTHQSIDNLEAILTQAGLSLDNVVKTTVFLADMSLFADMNAVYSSRFTAPFPARSAVAVRQLPKDALVEIEAIASR